MYKIDKGMTHDSRIQEFEDIHGQDVRMATSYPGEEDDVSEL
jgi:phage gp37-like protein